MHTNPFKHDPCIYIYITWIDVTIHMHTNPFPPTPYQDLADEAANRAAEAKAKFRKAQLDRWGARITMIDLPRTD